MPHTHPDTYADWQAVLDAHGNRPAHPQVRLSGGRLDPSSVAVTLSVDAHAPQPVEFADGLYGATAWAPAAPGSSAWRRADTAEMRLMIAPSLGPGQATEIRLPLAGAPRAVRVLLANTWLDVSR